MKRQMRWPWGRLGAFVLVAVIIIVGSLGVVGARVVMLLDGGCPRGVIDQQRDGLSAVKRQLPPGTIREQILNDCDSGDRPFFTLYAAGDSDPVRQLIAGDDAWSREAREPSDPERRGSEASRSFKDATLSVGSKPYTSQDQREQPEPGVRWFLWIAVD